MQEKSKVRQGMDAAGKWRVEFLMLPFQGEERKGQCLFSKGKGVCETTLDSRTEGRPEDTATWQRPTTRVGRHLN
jgi:hypothetical protein